MRVFCCIYEIILVQLIDYERFWGMRSMASNRKHNSFDTESALSLGSNNAVWLAANWLQYKYFNELAI